MSTGLDFSDYVSLSKACRLLPGGPHISTLHRWRLKGLAGVKLRTIRVGGRRYVALRELERFAQQTTAAADGSGSSSETAGDLSRERAITVARCRAFSCGNATCSGSCLIDQRRRLRL
ncbi:MAG: DUF1580 domain-containing protein [Planctomycetes bacterium]|nr:DUF1580 domain-containing protein [Planctomycetota bacterium]